MHLFVRIFPLCIPQLSQSAQNQLLQLVHCYVLTSSADDTAEDGSVRCIPVFDVSSLEDGHHLGDDDLVVQGSRQQLNQGQWTIDNGEWVCHCKLC